MNRLINWLLPAWAAPSDPLLGYEVPRLRGAGGKRRLAGQLVIVLALVGAGGYLYRAAAGANIGGNLGAALWQSLYFPALALQLLTLALAFWLGAASVAAERRHRTWDTLRATESGARLALRARWVSIFYRLAAPIAAILLLRLLFAGSMLTELTAFGGRMAHIISGNALPPLPDWRLTPLLIALSLAVQLLLPLVMLAAAAALGILLAVALRERLAVFLLGLLLMLALAAFTGVAALLIAQDLSAAESAGGAAQYALYLAYSSLGDWGLLQLHLGSLGEIWRRVPYGASITLGSALTLALLSAAADGMLALAARLAERRG